MANILPGYVSVRIRSADVCAGDPHDDIWALVDPAVRHVCERDVARSFLDHASCYSFPTGLG